ncbi:DUF5959 family protein [Streptomyces sp. NPDC051597]|uniref:DUF5959 family protein n=1 Tax=Streptomyces sp. NPDC051597 TaxID=3155049 RepID=UPI0034182B36
MGAIAPRELVSLADDEGNSVTIKVLGRDPGWSAGLDAEIIVRTPFVSGRIDPVLSTSKLESWATALTRLDAGKDVVWMEWDRGPSISIQLTGERGCPEVVVEDESGPWSPFGCRSSHRTTGSLQATSAPGDESLGSDAFSVGRQVATSANGRTRAPRPSVGYRGRPCSTPRRAITGFTPRDQTRRRYLSWSYPRSPRTMSGRRRGRPRLPRTGGRLQVARRAESRR